MVQKHSCKDTRVSAQSQHGSHPWVSAHIGDPWSLHVGVSMLLSPSVWGHNAVTLCLALKTAICGSAGCVGSGYTKMITPFPCPGWLWQPHWPANIINLQLSTSDGEDLSEVDFITAGFCYSWVTIANGIWIYVYAQQSDYMGLNLIIIWRPQPTCQLKSQLGFRACLTHI